jgi:hypothetical protein
MRTTEILHPNRFVITPFGASRCSQPESAEHRRQRIIPNRVLAYNLVSRSSALASSAKLYTGTRIGISRVSFDRPTKPRPHVGTSIMCYAAPCSI